MAKATKADALIIRKDGTKHTLIPAFSITTWSTHHELSGKTGIGIVIDLDDGSGHECLRIVDLTIKQARGLAQDIIEMANKLDPPSQA